MLDSKLYQILIVLSKSQQDDLLKYLLYELPNAKDNRFIIVSKMLLLIQKGKINIDKQDFFKSIFDNSLNNQKVNVLMSDTVKLIENFIVLQSVINDENTKNLYLTEFYYKNQLNTFFEQSFRKYETHKEEIYSLKGFSTQIETEFLHARYLALNNNRDVDLLPVRNILEEFYTTWKLKLDNIYGVSWKKENFDATPQNPLFQIHHQIHQLFQNQNEQLYLQTFEEIIKYENQIHLSELRVIMMLLDNFCIIQLNASRFNFIEHTFKLYQKMIDLKVLLDDDETILAGQYKNVITIALRTKSYDWANDFLEKFKDNIRDDQAEAVYIFNKANIAFEQEHYDNCLYVLSQMIFKDEFYKLTAKRLVIKSMYMIYQKDRTYYDTLYGNLNAFKKYIYTKKNLPEVYQETNKNFYKFIQQIFFASIKNGSDLDNLHFKIDECEMLADKNWLKQMVNMNLKSLVS